jgi:RNA polymerase sigma-70 factor, ECF subfamily
MAPRGLGMAQPGSEMAPGVGAVVAAAGRSDVDLVRRARAGDAAAFEAVAAGQVDAVFRLASAILGAGTDPAEATRATLVAAWRELPRLRRPEEFDGWLLRTLVTECRMRARQRAHGRDRITAQPAGSPAAGPATAGDVGLRRDQALDLLEHAFEALDPDDQALLVLHDLEQRSLTEIAASLHLPAGTVRWRLHEARGALLSALEPAP